MKLFNFKTSAKWSATWLSVATFVLSPVAMGQQAETISTAQAKNALAEMGLNKKITVGEFYQNTKNLYPERIRSQLEPVLMNYKNTLMPDFSVSTVKATDGRSIPNLAINYKGQLLNFQIFGEKEKYFKFENINLSEIDVINFTDMMTRMMAADEKLRTQNSVKPAINQSAAKKETQFNYPTITQESWKAMTPEDRANYMINLRLLWSDARDVLYQTQKGKKNKNRKTSSLEKLDLLWNNLFEHEAAAKVSAKMQSIRGGKTNETSAIDGTECLVAGYITNENASYCDHEAIKKRYGNEPNSLYTKANAACKSTEIACNPMVFGTPNGKPICITPSRTSMDFQRATHFEGPCERNNNRTDGGTNHLGSKVKFLSDDKKMKDRYTDNLLPVNIESEVKKEQEKSDFKATQDYLNGILAFQGKANLFSTGAIDETTLKLVLEINDNFKFQIDEAVKSCKVSSAIGNLKDKNFGEACDQLQRRFLFVKDYFQTKCPKLSIITDEKKLMCECGTAETKTEVPPGSAACVEKKRDQPPGTVGPKPDVEKAQPPVKTPTDQTLCPNGKPRKTITNSAGNVAEGDCEPVKPVKGQPSDSSSKFDWSTLGTIAITGGVLFAMYKLFSPKKPSLNPAGDTCPNGLKPPCGQTCPLPKSMLGGVCGCAACAPGLTSDPATCFCNSSPVTPPAGVLQTCPDGITKMADPANCPAKKYPCWDGSQVTNPLNCPEKPPTVVPKTTQ